MKNPVTVALSMWLATAALVFCLFSGCGGCAAGKGTYSPATGTNTTGVYDYTAPADILVVSVENIREIALDAFKNVMELEFNNRDALTKINPNIRLAVEVIRRDGEKSLNALTDAKVAYQKSRSAEDATKLKNALASVQSLLKSAVKYLAEIGAAPKGTP